MKQKEKDLLIKINENINKEYGLDPRTPITDTQRSLREMVKNSIEQYFEDLGGHETINLYELVLKEVEVPLLTVVLEQTKNNQSKAAKILGLNRGTLRKKLKQCDLI
jgi:Fis family transcriptional regulator|tara:strand:+ start:186 stop:506 length:321 start_codon:yes stop_codon:yes gene_type:complete